MPEFVDLAKSKKSFAWGCAWLAVGAEAMAHQEIGLRSFFYELHPTARGKVQTELGKGGKKAEGAGLVHQFLEIDNITKSGVLRTAVYQQKVDRRALMEKL